MSSPGPPSKRSNYTPCVCRLSTRGTSLIRTQKFPENPLIWCHQQMDLRLWPSAGSPPASRREQSQPSKPLLGPHHARDLAVVTRLLPESPARSGMSHPGRLALTGSLRLGNASSLSASIWLGSDQTVNKVRWLPRGGRGEDVCSLAPLPATDSGLFTDVCSLNFPSPLRVTSGLRTGAAT